MSRDHNTISRRAANAAGFLAVALAASVFAAALPQPSVPETKGRASSALAPGWTTLYNGYRSASGMHKLAVEAGAAAPAGATFAFDYGTFTLQRVGDAALASGKIEPAALRDHWNVVALRTGAIDTTLPQAQAMRTAAASGGKGLHLVQFGGPIMPEWVKGLEATGVKIVTAIPHNAYLVYGDAATLAAMVQAVRQQAHVQWDATYRVEWRVDTKLPLSGAADVTVQMFDDPAENAATQAAIAGALAAGAGEPRVWRGAPGYVNVTARVDTAAIDAIAGHANVVFVETYVTPRMTDELNNMVVIGNVDTGTGKANPGNWLTWLAGKGFNQAQFDASNLTVDVTDSAIESLTTNPNHFALRRLGPGGASRIAYARAVGTVPSGGVMTAIDGHGNLNSHIVGGYVPDGVPFSASQHADANALRYGLGVAPFVKLASSAIFTGNTRAFINPSFPELLYRGYMDGARISTNSWGASVGGAYNADSQAYDALVRDAQPNVSVTYPDVPGNQPMIIVFSAGNSGAGLNTIGSPGTAKNVITVGASEGPRPFGAADQCAIADAGSDNFNDIISFSSRGPTDDGRIKPDIVAPGTHVTGGVWQNAVVDPATIGSADPSFNGTGVCGGTGSTVPDKNFWPTTQRWTTASSGTSHSTPMVAGGAALVYQWFLNNSQAAPSPAMTRAILTNSTRYMTGVAANDQLPSNAQGMGLMDLERAFATVPRLLRDQVAGDRFTATGQIRQWTTFVSDGAAPLRITLAWTDAPGPTSGNAYLNDLDLEVVVGGQTYKGNVFAATGGLSATGGSADFRNNLESVFLPPQPVGTPVLIRVKATNIVADGVPGNAEALDQDFALIGYNVVTGNAPVIAVDSSALTAESFQPANGAADLGETVDVSVTLRNVGTSNAVAVVGTPVPTASATPLSGAQGYGTLAPNATASGTFTALQTAGTCLAPGSLALDLSMDGVLASSVTVPLGLPTSLPPVVGFSENFDAAIALPAGWTRVIVSGAPTIQWNVFAGIGDVANGVQGQGAASVTSQTLASPAIAVPVGAARAQLRFRHKYDLESTYDGAVLDISINGAAFQDIVAAGGSFVSGGYNATISTGYSSPIAGRLAWTGINSAAFSTVLINLPPAAIGQPIQLRWTVATDSSFLEALGYLFDTVTVETVSCESPLVTVSPGSNTFAPTRIGAFSAPQGFTVTNQTASAVALAQALTGADAANFGVTTPVCASVPGSGNCATGVRAGPAAPIGTKTALMALTATQGAKTQVHNVPLSVLATAPIQSLLPLTATLVAPAVGGTSGATTFALTNDGNASMAIASISPSGSGFARSGGTCPAAFPAILAAGTTCTVLLTYTAGGTGSTPGSLTVISDAIGSPQTAVLSGTVVAGLGRAFVSPIGTDGNDCSFILPCRTLQAGVNAAAAGGEVVIDQTGGYGNATVNKSLTITGARGATVGVAVTGTQDGVSITAPNAVVTLRNLSINGAGVGDAAVRVLPSATGAVVHLDNLIIANMGGPGIAVDATNATVFVNGSTVRGNLGPHVDVTVATGTVYTNGTRFEEGGSLGLRTAGGALMLRRSAVIGNAGNGVGVVGTAATRVVVEDSTIARNLGHGIAIGAAGHSVVIRRSSVTDHLGAGLSMADGTAVLDRANLSNNQWGVNRPGPGSVISLGNNPMTGNGSGNVGAITVVPRQ